MDICTFVSIIVSHSHVWYIFLGDNYSFSPFRPMTVKLLMLSATIQATKLLHLTLNNKWGIKKFTFVLVARISYLFIENSQHVLTFCCNLL